MYIHFRWKRSGQTLIEVVISVLILAITTVSVFSIFFANATQQPKADKKEQAAMLIKTAQQTLKAFVSVDPNDTRYSPNLGGLWGADASGRWALAEGEHDISSLMKGTVLEARNAQNSPVSCAYVKGCVNCCYMMYEVKNDYCLGSAQTTHACKSVTFRWQYPETTQGQ